MCLAVPMKIVELRSADAGVCELDGTRYDVDLSLIETPSLEEYVIVHAGFAIEKLDEKEADARLELFEEMARAYRESESGAAGEGE